jgi:hypothetical protein
MAESSPESSSLDVLVVIERCGPSGAGLALAEIAGVFSSNLNSGGSGLGTDPQNGDKWRPSCFAADRFAAAFLGSRRIITNTLASHA